MTGRRAYGYQVVETLPSRSPTIFAAAELTRNSPSAKMDVFSEGYGHDDLDKGRFRKVSGNHCGARVPARADAVNAMTGSGSCVFAPFAQESEACAALDARPPQIARFVARMLARQPVADFARAERRWQKARQEFRAGTRLMLTARQELSAGESPSWLRHRILIPAFEGSNPSSPAI